MKRIVKVRNLEIGNPNKVVIQSMTTFKTSKVSKVVKQILELEKYGCDLVRLAISDMSDAKAIAKIKKQVNIPLVADIQFDYKLALAAIKYGIDKIRINPGNTKHLDQVVEACKEKHIPIRVGINMGSLDDKIVKKYGYSVKGMLSSLKESIKLLEKYDFHDIVISLKSSNFEIAKEAYLKASKLYDYPMHIGITETGPLLSSITKSTLGLAPLIEKGICDTIRVSISDDPIMEIKVAKHLLASLNKIKMINVISCPTCGRTKGNVIKYAKLLEELSYFYDANLKIAIMGCAVNGPKEAMNADFGIAFSATTPIYFEKGKIIGKIDKDVIEFLKEKIESTIK